MGWLDHQVEHTETEAAKEEKLPSLMIQMPGCNTWIPINKHQVHRIYEDDLGGALMIIVDEIAELLQKGGVKTEAGKEEDALRQECAGNIQSITQLGRSAGIHMVIATQRNDTSIIPGVVQNNSLSLDTPVVVKRLV